MATWSGLQTWILDLLACPSCGGWLAMHPRSRMVDGALFDGALGCRDCSAPYPVLSGVPILVPNPAEWCATYEESILATLAIYNRATEDAVSLVNLFSSQSLRTEPLRFGDDWVASEGEGATQPPTPPMGTRGATTFLGFLQHAAHESPDMTLLTQLAGEPLGRVLEVGCGAGGLSQHLSRKSQTLLLGDLSLRAVLCALVHVLESGGSGVQGVVMDAAAIPLHEGSIDTLIAANLVDLLDEPAQFFEEATRVVTEGGRLALTTPDPQLGVQSPSSSPLLPEDHWHTLSERDGLPWVRAHRPRFYEVYFAYLLVARRQTTLMS